QQVLARAAPVALLVRDEPQIRPEERPLEAVRLPHAELADDVADDPAGGGRGERQDGHAAELLLERAEAAVRRAEVVSPLRDAVRLVYRHERDAGLAERAPKPAFEPFG